MLGLWPGCRALPLAFLRRGALWSAPKLSARGWCAWEVSRECEIWEIEGIFSRLGRHNRGNYSSGLWATIALTGQVSAYLAGCGTRLCYHPALGGRLPAWLAAQSVLKGIL